VGAFDSVTADRDSEDRIHERVAVGAVIEVCYPIFKHYAIVCDRHVNGYPTLISLSRRTGAITEEPWHQVTRERPIHISPIRGPLSGPAVVANARALMRRRAMKWNLLTCNCEHFVRLAHGLPAHSSQVRTAIKGAVIGAASTVVLPNVTLARVALFAGTGLLTSLRHYALAKDRGVRVVEDEQQTRVKCKRLTDC